MIGKLETDDTKLKKVFGLKDEKRAYDFLKKYRSADDTTKEIVNKLIIREEQDLEN